MANRTVTNLTAVLQMNNTKFKKGLTGSQKALKGFQNQIKNVGGMIAGAFAVGSIVRFGQEAVDLASKFQGVNIAFSKLKNSQKIFEDLRVATRNTVSDFKLMQMTVEASNMGIPIEKLARMFEFASKQAIRTGKSVDYLIEQLVLGIGRKSVQRLDDLGISLVQIQTEVKKTGDFTAAVTNIIEDNLKAMGDVGDTAATKIEQARAAWENFKTDAGEKGLQAFSEQASYFSDIDKIMDSSDLSGFKKMAAFFGIMSEEKIKALADSLDEFNDASNEFSEANENAGILDRDIKSGIDWIKVNDEILKQWKKEVKLIQERVKLQNSLTDAINETTHAQLEQLRQIAAAHAKQKADAKKAADKKRDAKNAFIDNPYGDYLNQPDEVWSGGVEPWEVGVDNDAIMEAFIKLENFKVRMDELKQQMNYMLEDFVSQGITSIFAELGESLVTDDFEGFFADILNMFGQFMVKMGGMIIAYGVAMDAFKKAFTNPMAAITAGIALAAIGGGIIGYSKKLSSMSSNASSGTSSVYSGGNVNFQISGQNLVGVMERYNNKTGRFT